MVVGFFLFGAAVLFRVLTEPLFMRADAAELWPFESSPIPASKDSRNA
jgi:Zn-dependent membrane protease YugP